MTWGRHLKYHCHLILAPKISSCNSRILASVEICLPSPPRPSRRSGYGVSRARSIGLHRPRSWLPMVVVPVQCDYISIWKYRIEKKIAAPTEFSNLMDHKPFVYQLSPSHMLFIDVALRLSDAYDSTMLCPTGGEEHLILYRRRGNRVFCKLMDSGRHQGM